MTVTNSSIDLYSCKVATACFSKGIVVEEVVWLAISMCEKEKNAIMTVMNLLLRPFR